MARVLTIEADGAEAALTRPSREPSSLWLFTGLFLLALLIQLIAVRRTLGPYDESLSLYGADRILHGGMPYRDFWTMYGPAQFYALALFFKLFGVSALAGRVYDALIRAGVACTCFLLVSRLASRRFAALAFGAVLLWLSCLDYAAYNFSIFPALLVSLISCLCFSRYLRDRSRLWPLFAAGVLVGITVSFRHDSGLYVCIAQIATLLWAALFRSTAGSSRLKALLAFGRTAILYISGVLIVVLPIAFLFLWKVPLRDLFYDLFYVPARIYPKMRKLPFIELAELGRLRHPFDWYGRSVLQQLIVFFPVLSSAAGLAALAIPRKNKPLLFDHSWQRDTFVLLTFLGLLFFIKGLVRVSPLQMLQSIAVATLVQAVLLSRLSRLHRVSSALATACALYLIACTFPLGVNFFRFSRANIVDLLHPEAPDSLYRTCHPPPGLERARCLLIEPDVIAAIQDVQYLTGPTDKIFVGAGIHDRIFWNDVRIYFVAGRASVTKWHELHPGVQTTLPIQKEIIDSMRLYAPKVVVLNTTWDDTVEPNESRYSSGVTALDEYIRENYVPRNKFGKVVTLTPKEPH